MRLIHCTLLVMITVILTGCLFNTSQASNGLTATYLRCEYRVDPLGIDVAKPRLSWVLQSAQRGQKQTAYQVMAASSPDLLDGGKGDLWDSGKVTSSETATVVYEGKPLASGGDCFWKVRVWDVKGKASEWSATAHWSAGLLKKSDWKAEWIGLDVLPAEDKLPAVFRQAKWIWSEAPVSGNQPVGERLFLKDIRLPKEAVVKSAVCYVSADNSFTLRLDGKEILSGRNFKTVKVADLTDSLKNRDRQSDFSQIQIAARNEGESPNPAGLIAALIIETDQGQTTITTGSDWVCTSGNMGDSKTYPVAVIGDYGSEPWGNLIPTEKFLPPARYLRKEFTADGPIQKARLYATSLGLNQLFINGQRVSDEYFSPGWTDYSKRIYYRTYDVTSLLTQGKNAVAAILADGWYAGYVGPSGKRNYYGKNLRLLAQLEIEYADGKKDVIATGPDWMGSFGPTLEADFLMGETYDARAEQPGWNKPGFNESAWTPVLVGGNEVTPLIQAAVAEPVRAFAEVKPVSVSEPAAGVYVFDMGQNFAGVVRMTVQGSAGQKIRLRFAERLNPDGTLYTTNLREARAIDTYICKGGGSESWQPYFTFHGFQYVEMTGVSEKPSLHAIVGLALSSDTPIAGSFECSDPMVNKIYSNSVWTQRMNFIDIPTDCPQRDERLGWTGDAQVYVNTACYITDVQAFFTKWLTDLVDAQRVDGQFPMVAPQKTIGNGDDGGPAWADAGVICPWTIYKMYGDKRVLESHYDAMKKFISFCEKRSTPELLPPAQFHCFGDWLNIKDDTPKEVIYMAYFAYSTRLTANAAAVLGHETDAAYYNDLFAKIKRAFNKAYVQEDGKIKGDSQCAYVLALAYDLVDGKRFQQAADHLVRKIEEKNWHLSTGFVGTKDLMLVLEKVGRNDIAYRLLHNDTFPSWGFSIKHGATSIWERWNGWTPEQGFGDPGMNSFAHYSFGAVCQWMFENIGGIRTDGPAFKNILLKPCPGGKLTWANVAYDSVNGRIESSWKILEGGLWQYDVTIPPNTTATLILPTSEGQNVRESGQPLKTVPTSVEAGMGFRRIELESGSYSFTSKL
ncbi:MAG: glycoside hydrolase family 78 protein [Planctomycetaceae bacterium]|nr:glycoside hydrolase family 78 protein [Planctomycetaceae bacterium]